MWPREALGDLFTLMTESIPCQDGETRRTFGTPGSDKPRMGWSELRKCEKKCTRNSGIRRGLCFERCVGYGKGTHGVSTIKARWSHPGVVK